MSYEESGYGYDEKPENDEHLEVEDYDIPFASAASRGRRQAAQAPHHNSTTCCTDEETQRTIEAASGSGSAFGEKGCCNEARADKLLKRKLTPILTHRHRNVNEAHPVESVDEDIAVAPAAETGVAHHPVARHLCEAVEHNLVVLEMRLKAFHAVVQLLAVPQPKRFRPARSREQLACPTSALAANVESLCCQSTMTLKASPGSRNSVAPAGPPCISGGAATCPQTSRRWCVSTATRQGHRLGQKPTDGQSCTWDRSA